MAPEELRISHDCLKGHGDQRKFWVFMCNNVRILEKNRALRAPKTTMDHLDHQHHGFATTDEKSDDPAKMTHSISDFGDASEPKNMPMAGQEV